MLFHPLIDFVEHFALACEHHVTLADVLDFGTYVHDDPRRRQLGLAKGKLRSLIRSPTAGRDSIRTRRFLKKIGVGDCTANRIRIGIAVPENIDSHGLARTAKRSKELEVDSNIAQAA